MKENAISIVFAALAAGISAYFQIIAIPIIVLLVVMIIDYITGMSAAYANAELSSKKGVKGILKKVGYVALVCVGIAADYLIYSALTHVGVESPVKMFFGLIVAIWLIINELLSILENLERLGVPIPKFLIKLIEKLKITVETKSGDDESKADE